jgi:hypothetical protein
VSQADVRDQKITIEGVEASDFEARIGQRFVFRMNSNGNLEPAELELLRVTRLDERPEGLTVRGVAIRSKPFSILFRSATHYPHLEFATAALDHADFAGFELLLACVTPFTEESGVFYYQAIFN